MIGTIPVRLTSVLSMVAMLVAGVLPAGAWAECGCAPGGCGTGSAKAACCSVEQHPTHSQCCEAAASLPIPANAKCCCTAVVPRACSQSDTHHAGGGCECSPSRPSQAPANNPSTIAAGQPGISGALPPWTTSPLCFELKQASSSPTDVLLNAPPVPLRELYCVWRI
jgi:hypothetical protein